MCTSPHRGVVFQRDLFGIAQLVEFVVVDGMACSNGVGEPPSGRLPRVGGAVLQAEVQERDLVEDGAVLSAGGCEQDVAGGGCRSGEVKELDAVLNGWAPGEEVFGAGFALAAEWACPVGAGAVAQ